MKFRVRVIVVMALIMLLIFSACNSGSNKETKPNNQQVLSIGIDKVTDENIKLLIGDYFSALYSTSPEMNMNLISSGNVPDNIKNMLASTTVNESVGNPEIGIHLPRFVEINGNTVVSYEFLKNEKDGLDVKFLKRNGDKYNYYAKLKLKGRFVKNEVFDNAFAKRNDNTYEKKAGAIIDESQYDSMILQALYDVEVVKENEGFKILTAKETNAKYGYKFRVHKSNNDFVVRLPWLNLEKSGNEYVNKADGERYTRESEVISALFENMKKINAERRLLLTNSWEKGEQDFKNFLDKIAVLKNDKGEELLLINSEYKTKFEINSFPLQAFMDKISSYENLIIRPHPVYSEKNRKYIVTMDASVTTKNIALPQKKYKYDYWVDLEDYGSRSIVKSIKLNECAEIINNAGDTSTENK